jgi:hypothetical protein
MVILRRVVQSRQREFQPRINHRIVMVCHLYPSTFRACDIPADRGGLERDGACQWLSGATWLLSPVPSKFERAFILKK